HHPICVFRSFPTRRSSDLGLLHHCVDDLGFADDVRVLTRPRGAWPPALEARLEGRPDPNLHRLDNLRPCLPHATPGALVKLCQLDRKSTRLNSSHVSISYA